jgi:hypothetical protein
MQGCRGIRDDQLIDADILQSRRMVLRKWRNRKFGRRLNERLALLLRSQL